MDLTIFLNVTLNDLSTKLSLGAGKRGNEFAEWHVAWLAEWHNYAEFNLWKMAQRKNIQQESMRASLPRLFWRQFERAIDLPVHLLLQVKQG